MKTKILIVIILPIYLLACNVSKQSNITSYNSEKIQSDTLTEFNSSNLNYTQDEFEYVIDRRLDQCIIDNSSNYGMKTCTLNAITEWESEMIKYYDLLKDTLIEGSKNALVKSQQEWEKYSQSELELNHSIYNQLEGTLWSLISIGQTLSKIKERALQLKDYYEALSGEAAKE